MNSFILIPLVYSFTVNQNNKITKLLIYFLIISVKLNRYQSTVVLLQRTTSYQHSLVTRTKMRMMKTMKRTKRTTMTRRINPRAKSSKRTPPVPMPRHHPRLSPTRSTAYFSPTRAWSDSPSLRLPRSFSS
jgi:hypothetical protein